MKDCTQGNKVLDPLGPPMSIKEFYAHCEDAAELAPKLSTKTVDKCSVSQPSDRTASSCVVDCYSLER